MTDICKDGKKMSGKLKNSQILLSSGGITPAKMNQLRNTEMRTGTLYYKAINQVSVQ
jgi:hypothetical protein